MKSIYMKNFRCFREEQKARIAPLTLLVGENSSGKTSFMAMIRALWKAVYEDEIPDFKENPYDLGSFDDIAHHRGRRGGRAEAFEAGFEAEVKPRKGQPSFAKRFSIVFGREGSAPVPVLRRFEFDNCWIEEHRTGGNPQEIRVGTSKGSWKYDSANRLSGQGPMGFKMKSPYVFFAPYFIRGLENSNTKFIPLNGSPDITEDDWNEVEKLLSSIGFRRGHGHSYASAPVRSQPQRIYEPGRPVLDPGGDYVPLYLAAMRFQNKKFWASLKKSLENFGHVSDLFDEIEIKPLGKREGEPFQLRIRKFGGKLKGPPRNIKDVGYGVSQVLPVITELLRENENRRSRIFLLQQPEIHLHPKAQAALGSFFCELANQDRQIIVETHSDHLLDRVRMDVRDGKGSLTTEDVSILYFERNELNVCIHSLRLDEKGNVRDAPKGYRAFFMEEMKRSLGF